MKTKNRINVIDLFDLGVPLRTGCFVLNEDELTIIETGPSPSVKHIKAGLHELGYTLDDLKYIIVTHIHLDHSGGVGLLLQACPNAKVVVHEYGARHLIDPTRLVAGARGVYGDDFQDLFEPIVPVPEEKVMIKKDGDTLQISDICTLEFWDTPGHSNHHLSIYDPVSNGMFTGDTVGIRYEQLAREGIEFYIPSTSPNQFNPVAMTKAIKRMKDKELDVLFFGHFGFTENVKEAFKQVEYWLPIFVSETEKVYEEGGNYGTLSERLHNKIQEDLRSKGLSDDHPIYGLIQLDATVSAMGLLEYVKKSGL